MWVESARANRIRQANLLQDLGQVVRDVGGPTSDGLIENRSQCVDIRHRTDGRLVSRSLLGRHVRGRSQDDAGLSDASLRVVVQPSGQAEIGDLRLPVRSQQNVGWLQVTMDDPPPVGVIDGFGERQQQLRGGSCPERRFGEDVFQTRAGHEFHDQEWLPVLLTRFEHLRDMRMMEAGGSFRLQSKTSIVRAAADAPRQDHLDGNQTIYAQLPGLVDDSHATTANLLQQGITSQERPPRRFSGAGRLVAGVAV